MSPLGIGPPLEDRTWITSTDFNPNFQLGSPKKATQRTPGQWGPLQEHGLGENSVTRYEILASGDRFRGPRSRLEQNLFQISAAVLPPIPAPHMIASQSDALPDGKGPSEWVTSNRRAKLHPPGFDLWLKSSLRGESRITP